MTKKLIALFLALVTCFSVLAGCTTPPPTGTGGGDDDDHSGLNGKTIQICLTPIDGLSHNDCYLTGAVEEKLGCNLDYNELDDFGTVYAASQLSDGSAPDITFFSGYNATYEQYGIDEAYINIYDHLDKMPNVKAYLEANPKLVQMYETEDGCLYVIPKTNVGGSATRNAYLYREDIFAELGLTWPTNQEQFEDVLYKLKKAYPQSFPFIMRNMTGNAQGVQAWSYLWGSTHTLSGAYNTIFTLDENGNYYNGMVSDAYKEMGQYLQWLKAEKLLDPSSYTLTTQTWYEAMASNRAFITYDKVDRLPYINMMGQTTQGESFKMVAGKPFNMGSHASKTSEVVTASGSGGAGGGAGYLYLGDNDNLDVTCKYVDWLFSDDGFVTTNWGIQGESYEVDENGKKYFLESFLDKYGTLLPTGLNTNTTGGNWDMEAFKGICDEDLIEALELSESMGVGPRQYNLKYNRAERHIWDTYYKACNEYARSEWMNMVMGYRAWDEWDDLKAKLKERYHEDELLAIAKSALERIPYKD